MLTSKLRKRIQQDDAKPQHSGLIAGDGACNCRISVETRRVLLACPARGHWVPVRPGPPCVGFLLTVLQRCGGSWAVWGNGASRQCRREVGADGPRASLE